MTISRLLKSLRQSIQGKRSDRRQKVQRRLEVESLEERLVPTILFTPQFGAETATVGSGSVLSNVPIHLVFNGSFWADSANQGQVTALENSVSNIVNSAYLSRLRSYRSDLGTATFNPSTGAVVDSNGLSPGFGFIDLGNAVERIVNNGQLPDNTNALYVVVTPPGVNSHPGAIPTPLGTITIPSEGDNAPGYHAWYPDFDSLPIPTFDHIRVAWVESDGTVDGTTPLLAHEIVESISDPNGGIDFLGLNPSGITASGGLLGGGGSNEIGDGEAQNYTYRVPDPTFATSGVLVQSYWSQVDGAFAVPDGNFQNFRVDPQFDNAGNRIGSTLVVNGDQLADPSDSLFVNVNDAGGVVVNLNGDVASFARGQINAITLNSGTGNDTITVAGTPQNVPVTINLGGGSDTVNLGPFNYNLDTIQSSVTVNGGSGSDTLNVDDQSGPAGVAYQLNAPAAGQWSVIRNGATVVQYSGMTAVNLNGSPSGAQTNQEDSYTVQATEPGAVTTITTGSGTNNVNVQATQGALNIAANDQGQPTHLAVLVTNNQTVQTIQGAVTLQSQGVYTADLTVDDSADTAAQFGIGVSATALTGLAPASITYQPGTLSSLTVDGGSGGNVFAVADTPGSGAVTTLNTGTGTNSVTVAGTTGDLHINGQGGPDSVYVGNNGSVQAIQGNISVSNLGGLTALTVDDSADTTSLTMNLTNAAITGLAPATISYDQNALASLTVMTGSGTNVDNIQSTPNRGAAAGTTMTSFSALGTATVNVGNAHTVQGIQGTLYLTAASGALTVDDGSDATARTVTLDGVDPLYGLYNNITGLAPAVIHYSTGSWPFTSVTIDGGTGSMFSVLSTAASTPVTINLNGQSGSVTLGSPTVSLAGIQCPVTVNGGGAATLNLDDQTGQSGTAYQFDVSGLFQWAVTRNGTMVARYSFLGAVNVNGSPSGTQTVLQDSYTVNSTALGTVTTITTGSGTSNVNVHATLGALNVAANDQGQPTHLNVTVSSHQSVQAINGAVSLLSQGVYTADLVVDDSADTTAQPSVTVSNTSLTGLAPAPIFYQAGTLSSLTVSCGSGGNTITVGNTPGIATSGTSAATTLNAGSSHNTITVLGTTGPLTINAGGATGSVTVGSPTVSLDTIRGNVTIHGQNAAETVSLMDSAPTSGSKTYTLNNATMTRSDSSHTTYGTVSYDTIGQLRLNSANTGGHLVVDFSAGNPIPALGLFFTGGSGANTMTLQADSFQYATDNATGPAAGNFTLVNSVPAASATITYANVQTINDLGTPRTGSAPANYLTFNAPVVTNAITVGDGTLVNNLQTTQISSSGTYATLAVANRGNVTVNSPSASDLITVNTAHRAAGLTSLTINAATVTPANYNNPQIIHILATPAGVNTTLNAANGWHNIGVGDGTHALNGIQGAVTVSGQVYQDTLTLTDSASIAMRTYTMHANSITGSLAGGMTPAPITWQGQLSVVALYGSTAADTFVMQSQPVGLAAMVVNGAYRQNTVQSMLASNHSWWIYPTSQFAANGTTVVLDYGAWPVPVTFNNVWNLHGGPGAERYEFIHQNGQDGSIGGYLDGGGTGDWLDYSANTNPVTVNLATGTATGVGGGIRNMQHVTGSMTASNNLTGNSLGNVLIGGAAADTLVAGSGSSILIGGGGADTLIGNRGTPGFDILIAGRTDFDVPNPADFTVLSAFFGVWQNTNANNYRSQVTLLRDTGLQMGGTTYGLNNSSVHTTSSVPASLQGATATQTALDWFFATAGEVQNLKGLEIVTTIH